MRKNIAVALALFFVFGFVAINSAKADTLSSRLKGRILLQVESKGEAWYVNPKDGKRYYMANGDEAYNIMRNLGVGITNKDLTKLQSNKNLAKKQSGKIFLQVESSGEAYYVDFSGNLHYLQNGAEAYKAMRELGMGIKNIDLSKILQNGEVDISNLKILKNADIIEKIKPSVVYIETTDGSGSGFVIDLNGHILTNAHVVQGFSVANVIFSDNSQSTASVVGRDEKIDLAILKVNKSNIQAVALGDSNAVKQGDEVFTFGYPFGIKGDVSFKEGTISRRLTDSGSEYLETSAEIHPGNSGGPLVNQYGLVVGINSAGLGQNIQGISVGETIKLAIPINTAKSLLSDLKSGRSVLVKSQKEIKKEKEAQCQSVANKMYTDLLLTIESSFSINDPKVQQLLNKIDNEEQALKNDRDSSIADINRRYDLLISQQRSATEQYISSIKVSQSRIGRSDTTQIAQAQSDGDSRIASLEASKQSQIANANNSYQQYYLKYEALRQGVYSDLNKQKDTAKRNAKNSANQYYGKCINE